MKNSGKKVLVLGAGGVGAWAARELAARGHEVVATTSNGQTARALSCLGVSHMEWHWEHGASWRDILALNASHWLVTVPPRMGPEWAIAFHNALQDAAEEGHVERLVWTSSTAVYEASKTGTLVESDEGHHISRHSGVDMLQLEDIHRRGNVPFVAMRLGGLFGVKRHPVKALLRRGRIENGDGLVQWVHERDAAAACVLALLHPDDQPVALNVVAPAVRTRRALIEATMTEERRPAIHSGGVSRQVSSNALGSLGFQWQFPDPLTWVMEQGAMVEAGTWEGPHGRLNWSKHPSHTSDILGRLLMVHGYKGFREWGLWRGVAEHWAKEGWEVFRMDFSHNGHLEPFAEDCLDEVAWSQNRLHVEVDEVAFALHELANMDGPVMVMGHSRGGGIAALGGRMFQKDGGSLSGAALWAPVSDFFRRFPEGADLTAWEASNRLEVRNGRTGQTLIHPFAFYKDADGRRDELNILEAASELTCPVLVIHGSEDVAVPWPEGKALAKAARRGRFECIQGADHVFGMSHPWKDASQQPPHLQEALALQSSWLAKVNEGN